MNFLLRHSFSSSDLPSVSQDADRDPKPAPDVPAPFASPARDSDGDDVRAAGDSLRTRNRVAIEDHIDVPEDDGGILLPSRELPKNWHLSGDMTSLSELDRGFVFPGEQLNIVIYISSHDALMPEIITPFKVAAMMDKVGVVEHKNNDVHSEALSHENLNGSIPVEENQNVPAELREAGPSMKGMLPVSESLLRMEGQKKMSAALLHSFENSHFFTRISGSDEQSLTEKSALDQSAEELDDGIVPANSSERKKSLQSVGSVPVVIEGGDFDPKIAGGVARNARCFSLGNGDTAVVIQVAVATDLKNEVVLEVLQFEQPWDSNRFATGRLMEGSTEFHENYSNSSEQLLQWLLPLDWPSSPPMSSMPATPASFVNSSPLRPALSGSSGSTLFSFANLRMSSAGSVSQSLQSSVSSTPPQVSSTYGSDEWDRQAGQRISKAQSVGSEGICSFRGTQVEPQRFSVHCGLEGLYVPGRRWRRNLEIVEPIAIESYFTDCNTKDLICVLIENVVPDHLPGIVIIVDSVSIVFQSAGPNRLPLSVPIACIEAGEDRKLPGLSLRHGEQHSLILKPARSPFQMSVTGKGKDGVRNSRSSHDLQSSKMSNNSLAGSGKSKAKEHNSNYFPDSGTYALVVSCRCSHTESRLHYKHPIQWQPHAQRDLLLSVSLEPSIAPMMPNGSFSPLLSQVLMVQATNLTTESLNLTLLAPSSRSINPYSSALFPSFPPRMSSFMSLHEKKEWLVTKNEENDFEGDKSPSEASSKRPGSLQRSMSLPPARPIESIMGITPMVVKERAISAADIAAENNLAWTHLWLQSTIPLGSVPPQSTTAVRCEIVPLTDGIITLDTLNISTKEDVVYSPEKPLQIYATSSIGSGLL